MTRWSNPVQRNSKSYPRSHWKNHFSESHLDKLCQILAPDPWLKHIYITRSVRLSTAGTSHQGRFCYNHQQVWLRSQHPRNQPQCRQCSVHQSQSPSHQHQRSPSRHTPKQRLDQVPHHHSCSAIRNTPLQNNANPRHASYQRRKSCHHPGQDHPRCTEQEQQCSLSSERQSS